MGESSNSGLEVPSDGALNSELVYRENFANYAYDGNFCVYIKIVHDRKEAEEDIREDTFYPDFVHQFFGEKEHIFGYKRPVLRMFYTAGRLKRYIKFDYEDKLTKEKDGIEPDDIFSLLAPVTEDIEFTQDLNSFISEVESKEEASFRPPGELMHQFRSQYRKHKLLSRAQIEQLEMTGEKPMNGHQLNGNSEANGSSKSQNGPSQPSSSSATVTTSKTTSTKTYQIFHANSSTDNFASFQSRMQSLVMWFIESATMIDFQDPRWDFFMIFEKFNPMTSEDPDATSVSTEDRYYFAGYATVYRYYAYPDRTRPRVSQMLILPPYRRNGLGTTLLQLIYDYYKKQPETLDITAEDPDEEFISMRDLLDCKNCLQLPAFHPEKLRQGWSEEIAKEAQNELRLCQRQSRKIYEILKLKCIDQSDEDEYRNYRLEIKNRLNIPNQRLKLDCDKVEKRGHELPEEMRFKRDNQKLIVAELEENYQELVRQYQHTIDKLDRGQ